MLPIVITIATQTARVAGTSFVAGAGLFFGNYLAQRATRYVEGKSKPLETPAPVTRDRPYQTELVKMQLINLAGHGRKLEDVMQDPILLHAIAAIDRAVRTHDGPPVQAPLQKAA